MRGCIVNLMVLTSVIPRLLRGRVVGSCGQCRSCRLHLASWLSERIGERGGASPAVRLHPPEHLGLTLPRSPDLFLAGRVRPAQQKRDRRNRLSQLRNTVDRTNYGLLTRAVQPMFAPTTRLEVSLISLGKPITKSPGFATPSAPPLPPRTVSELPLPLTVSMPS